MFNIIFKASFRYNFSKTLDKPNYSVNHKSNVVILIYFRNMIFKSILFICFLCLALPKGIAQPINNACDNAIVLCANEAYAASNIGANTTLCPNCEDDFNFCFSPNNTVWFQFTSNSFGGNLSVNIDQLVLQNNPGQGNALQISVFTAELPCISSSYEFLDDCYDNVTNNSVLNFIDLQPNTTYYIVVGGAMGTSSSAEGNFNITLNGAAIQNDAFIFIDTDTLNVCNQTPVVFSANIENCINQGTISWYINNELIAETLENELIYYDLSDQDTVSAIVNCVNDCQDSLFSNELIMNVHSFNLDAGPDFNIFSGEEVMLLGSTDATDYYWEPAINISNTNSLTPVVFPEETTVYTLFASDSLCSLTSSCTVFVEQKLVIPNTFSPNADGINDTWEILGIEKFPDAYVQIFTRWGQLVYQTTGYSKDKFWNGKVNNNGRMLTESVYYYVLDLRSNEYNEPLKGTITIIK